MRYCVIDIYCIYATLLPMTWIRQCAYLVLALGVVLAGVPAQAMPACPMMKMQQAQQAASDSAQGHESCHMAVKVKTNKCCTDPACNAKCSALSGGLSIDLPARRAVLSARDRQPVRLPAMTGSLVSHLLAPQERPPRILA